MEILSIIALVIGAVVLIFLTLDYITLHRRGPPALRRVGCLVFGTERRVIVSYEILVFALLLFWVLPVLWADVGLLEYRQVYVLVMFLSAPVITYVLTVQRFSASSVQHGLRPGEILEKTIEQHFRAGSLEEFLRSILAKMTMTESDPVWTEFRNARASLLSRDDDVGVAFRKALERIEADQSSPK